MFQTFIVNAGPDNGFPSKVFSIVFVPWEQALRSVLWFLLYTFINCMYAKEYTRLNHENVTYNQMHLTVRCWCGGAVTLKKLGRGLQCQERKTEQT